MNQVLLGFFGLNEFTLKRETGRDFVAGSKPISIINKMDKKIIVNSTPNKMADQIAMKRKNSNIFIIMEILWL
jgi:hypothetical protein